MQSESIFEFSKFLDAKARAGKMKAYAFYSEWKKDQSLKNQKLIGALQRLVKRTAPLLVTSVKWGQGVWLSGTVPKIFIHTEPDHIQFGFYNGSALKDPDKLLVGKGMYVRHTKVRTAKDIKVPTFTALILEAIQ